MTTASELSEVLFDCVPVPLLLIDAHGRIVKANLAECRLLGYPADKMLGRPLLDFIADEEKQASQERFSDFFNGMEMAASHRRRFRTEAGEYLICELSVRLIESRSDDGPMILAASADVTAQVAEACRRGEFARWMEASFRSQPQATMILDTLGRIRFLNHAAERLLGWSEAEASGQIAEDLIPWSDVVPSDGAGQDYEFRTGIVLGWSGSATVITRGGIARQFQIRTEPVVDPNGLTLGIASCLNVL
jgi:two-component system sensor kinase FixL